MSFSGFSNSSAYAAMIRASAMEFLRLWWHGALPSRARCAAPCQTRFECGRARGLSNASMRSRIMWLPDPITCSRCAASERWPRVTARVLSLTFIRGRASRTARICDARSATVLVATSSREKTNSASTVSGTISSSTRRVTIFSRIASRCPRRKSRTSSNHTFVSISSFFLAGNTATWYAGVTAGKGGGATAGTSPSVREPLSPSLSSGGTG